GRRRILTARRHRDKLHRQRSTLRHSHLNGVAHVDKIRLLLLVSHTSHRKLPCGPSRLPTRIIERTPSKHCQLPIPLCITARIPCSPQSSRSEGFVTKPSTQRSGQKSKPLLLHVTNYISNLTATWAPRGFRTEVWYTSPHRLDQRGATQ